MAGWLLKYHGQRLFEAAWYLVLCIGKPLLGGAGLGTRSSYYIWLSTGDTCTKEPHLFALCEVSSQQTQSIFFYALVLNFLEMKLVLPLLYFTAAHRTVSFLEPYHCFLSQLRNSKETYSRLTFVFGNCIRICPNYFCIYPKPICCYFTCSEGSSWVHIWMFFR